MDWYKRYPGDYARDTAHLSMTEHGVYTLMLDIAYGTEKPLPTGKPLYRLLRCETQAEKKATDHVLSEFWNKGAKGWIHKRVQEEIKKASVRREVCRRNASKSVRK